MGVCRTGEVGGDLLEPETRAGRMAWTEGGAFTAGLGLSGCNSGSGCMELPRRWTPRLAQQPESPRSAW